MRPQGRSQIIQRDGFASGEAIELPAPNVEVLAGVRWGRHDCLFTPAYWAAQAWHHAEELAFAPLRMGTTLVDEVAACLLGGYGTPAETGSAAFNAVHMAGLLDGPPATAAEIEVVLSQPLLVNHRLVRYRFSRQRSKYL